MIISPIVAYHFLSNHTTSLFIEYKNNKTTRTLFYHHRLTVVQTTRKMLTFLLKKSYRITEKKVNDLPNLAVRLHKQRWRKRKTLTNVLKHTQTINDNPRRELIKRKDYMNKIMDY